MAIEDLFTRVREEIPGALALAMGSLDGEIAARTTGRIDLAEVRRPLGTLLATYADLYEGLGGPVELGSNDELLITASRAYLLVKVHHERRRFVAVLLDSSGNLGYLRFRMRDYLRHALREA